MRSKLISNTLLCLALTAGTQVHAQSSNEDDAAAGAGLLLLSTTAGIALAGIGSYFISTRDDDNKKAAFLRANETQLTYELAMGEGPVIDHLAAMVLVPNAGRPAFARRLAQQRDALLHLARAGCSDPAAAGAFFAQIAHIARAQG